MRNLQLPGRSPVHGLGGMAATSQPLASLAAITMLQAGGNAVDAAITACAVQCVIEPQSTGIGGDCFALISPKGSAEPIAYNGSGRAPAAATVAWYAAHRIREIDSHTPHAVTVPGAIDAWARLIADHGRKSLGDVLQPAIAFARDGFAVSSRIASDWWGAADTLAHDENAARMFLADGKTPSVGGRHRFPELAKTLEIIAEHGRDGFYTGPVAEDIVGHLQSLGGLHTLDDFAKAAGEYVTPIKTEYAGFEVWECPPNGQGMAALEILNILGNFDVSGLEPLSAERLHLEIEAVRLAYQDRDNLLADPAMADVPVDWLLSADHAQERAQAISRDRAMGPLPPSRFPEHADTVYLCVVDGDGCAVSLINSIFKAFGSGICGPESGVILHNRGAGFVLDPNHPNCIAPGKRPMHTIIPGMAAKDGRAVMPFGVMGGHYQAAGHAHFLTNLWDFGLDLQEALDLPRLFPLIENYVEVEAGMPPDTIQGLEKLGHRFVGAEKPIGGGQAIWIDHEAGVLTGASDPRKDGAAIGY